VSKICDKSPIEGGEQWQRLRKEWGQRLWRVREKVRDSFRHASAVQGKRTMGGLTSLKKGYSKNKPVKHSAEMG